VQQRVFHVDPLPLVTDVAPNSHPKSHIAFRLGQNDKRTDALQGPCYTMRTYMFTKGNGSAPKPKGYTTCVSSDQLQMRQAAPPARLVPQ
jgi:hypothetical protein